MTQTEFERIKGLLQSRDQELVFLGYGYIIADDKYAEIKKHFSKQTYDNRECPTIENTIGELCKFLETVNADNTFMINSWNILCDSLYIPAGLQFMDSMKDYLIEK